MEYSVRHATGEVRGPNGELVCTATSPEIAKSIAAAMTAKARVDAGEMIELRWSISDVMNNAASRGQSCTEEQAREVLRRAKHHHNAELGVSWDVLTTHLAEVKQAEDEFAQPSAATAAPQA